MRTVAKRLFFASSAAAPSVSLAGLELDLVGAELRSLWLCHRACSLSFPPFATFQTRLCLANSTLRHKELRSCMLICSVTLEPKIRRCNDSHKLRAGRAQLQGKTLSRWPIRTIEGEIPSRRSLRRREMAP